MSRPVLHTDTPWEELHSADPLFAALCQQILPTYLHLCRWFGGKSGDILSVGIDERIYLQQGFRHFHCLVLEVFFRESFAHHYFLPLAISRDLPADIPESGKIVEVELPAGSYWLIDAIYDSGFHECLFQKLISGKPTESEQGRTQFQAFGDLPNPKPFVSRLLQAEQSNSTVVIHDRFFLKIFRRLFRDKNPDFEINEFLSSQEYFRNSPQLAGLMAWHTRAGYEISLGLMQHKVENQGDAWTWMLGELKNYFQKFPGLDLELDSLKVLDPMPVRDLPYPLLKQTGSGFFQHIEQLALRTAQMHIALARERRNRDFVPITYNSDFTVWLKNRLIYQFEARYNLLHKKWESLPAEAQKMAQEVMAKKDRIINFILSFDEENLLSFRIRIHGDYHLGQILIQEDDFYILDFEGEPESTIRDRKVKQSPLKDVAGLLRSFHYALFAVLFEENPQPSPQRLQQSQILYRAMSNVFLHTYFELAFSENLDIGYRKEIDYLLHYFLLEKAIYELGYELNGRPTWASIPLRGVAEILNEIEAYDR